MPTSSGLGIRTIADIVQTITHCSTPQANAAERAICSSRENIAALAATTGVAIVGAGTGGSILLAQTGHVQQPTTNVVLTPRSLLQRGSQPDAKRFCHAAIQGSQGKSGDHISRNVASSLGIGAVASGTSRGSAAGIAGGTANTGKTGK